MQRVGPVVQVRVLWRRIRVGFQTWLRKNSCPALVENDNPYRRSWDGAELQGCHEERDLWPYWFTLYALMAYQYRWRDKIALSGFQGFMPALICGLEKTWCLGPAPNPEKVSMELSRFASMGYVSIREGWVFVTPLGFKHFDYDLNWMAWQGFEPTVGPALESLHRWAEMVLEHEDKRRSTPRSRRRS